LEIQHGCDQDKRKASPGAGTHSAQSDNSQHSPHRLLKTALWLVWLPIGAVLWVMLLDISYDWISSPSTSKVIGGFLILILMAYAVIGLMVRGVRKLWKR
jgi:hypothetical protein